MIDWTIDAQDRGSQIDKKILLRIAQSVIGWIFVVVGVVGIFLPLLQGVLFIVIGLTILSTRNVFARRLLKSLERKYPDAYAKVEALKREFSHNKTLIIVVGFLLVILLGVGIYLAYLGARTAIGKVLPLLTG